MTELDEEARLLSFDLAALQLHADVLPPADRIFARAAVKRCARGGFPPAALRRRIAGLAERVRQIKGLPACWNDGAQQEG